MIKVGVLDSQQSFAEALSLALEFLGEVDPVGVASSVDDAIALAQRENPDVLLVDYQVVGGTGIYFPQRMEDEGVDARLILLTAVYSDDLISRALSHGFEQVVSKEAPLTKIVEAVKAEGAKSWHSSMADPIRFSRRQSEVLELMGQGLDPSSISEELFISVHTARSHVKDVLRALNVSTQLAAVTKALREGYLLPPRRHDVRVVSRAS